jgi:hypothetical protein
MASTIQVDKITDIGGNTIISSNGSGTFTSNLPAVAPNVSTATGTLPIANGGTGAATLSAAGLANTPAFFVTLTANQTVSDNVKTLVTWTNEVYDTNSAFASNKFTVPSGQAGKYNFYINVTLGTSGSWGVRNPRAYIYKNGTSIYYFQGPNNEQGNDNIAVNGTLSLDLAVADYIEVYGRNDNDQGTPYILGKSGDSPNEERTWFGGYKVIGA